MNSIPKLNIYKEIEGILGHLLKPSQPIHSDRALFVDSASIWKDLRIGSPLIQELESIANLSLRLYLCFYKEYRSGHKVAKNLLRQLNGKTHLNVLEIPRIEKIENGNRKENEPSENGNLAWIRYLDQLIKQKENAHNTPPRQIDIIPEELEEFLPERLFPNKHWECSIHFHIRAKSLKELNQGNYQIIVDSIQGTVANSFSRFAHLFSSHTNAHKDSIQQAIKDYYSATKKFIPNNTKRAGILYAHWTHVDAAGWSPSYHDLEIEAMGPPSGLPVDKIIPLQELFFKIDETNGKVRVIWEKPNKPPQQIHTVYDGLLDISHETHVKFLILPHNYQAEEFHVSTVDPFNFFHPTPRHFPRIAINRVILFKERWSFKINEIEELEERDLWKCFVSINRWRKKFGMPRHVFARTLSEALAKKRFLVDYENPFSINVFCSTLRKAEPEDKVIITEMFPEPDHLWTENNSGNFAHEFILAFYGTT